MKITAPNIPAAITGEVLSRHIDWSDKERPQITFQIQLSGPGGKEVFKYSGGLLAFMTDATRKSISGPFWKNDKIPVQRALQAITGCHGKVRFSPEDKKDPATLAAGFLLSNAVPELPGLLHCLTMDASALDVDFEEWAADLGYNPDSRKDHALYEECRSQSRRFKKCVGEHFDAIAEALQDY
jgi:hypothetical protein